eukprot:g3970.t1
MGSLPKETTGVREFKIKDLTQADFGRLEIQLAEAEMPGLMACRKEFSASQPLAGARIGGSLHMTVESAVLIETLTALGADVRWCSCNIFSTQDHAAAAIARDTCSVFAWKGERLDEYWWCTLQMLTWPDGAGPDVIIDTGGDAMLLIREGMKAEDVYATDGTLPDPATTENQEFKIVLSVIRETIQKDAQKWHKLAARCVGVSEETTSGVRRLYQLEKKNILPFPAISVNDSVTKSKFENTYGCRHSLPDGIRRATDIMIAGKTVFVAGYGDVAKGCCSAMRGAGARVLVAEVDPICALQACMEGYSVVTLEDALEVADIFITATGNKNIIMAEHMKKMKNNAIIGNIGHFDNEIDMQGLITTPGIKRQNIKPQCDRFRFEDGKGVIVLAEGRLLNLGCATGNPSFIMSCSFTNQVLAQLELWTKRSSGKYENRVYSLPRQLDEKVALLHLPKLGAKMTRLTEAQAEYVNVSINGPFKPPHYRY